MRETGNTKHLTNDTWWKLATQLSVVRRGIAYAIIVGTVLITINHGDAIVKGDISSTRLLKMVLTAVVPYLVSTFSSVGAMRKMGNRV